MKIVHNRQNVIKHPKQALLKLEEKVTQKFAKERNYKYKSFFQ